MGDRLSRRFREILDPKREKKHNHKPKQKLPETYAEEVAWAPSLKTKHTNFTFRGAAAHYTMNTNAIRVRLTGACPQPIKIMMPNAGEYSLTPQTVLDFSFRPPNRRRTIRFYNAASGAASVLIDEEILE